MKTDDVYFGSDLQRGMREFAADTPEKALEIARQFTIENPGARGRVTDFTPGKSAPVTLRAHLHRSPTSASRQGQRGLALQFWPRSSVTQR